MSQPSKIPLARKPAGTIATKLPASGPGSRLVPLFILLLFTVMIVPLGFDYWGGENGSTNPDHGDAFSLTTWPICCSEASTL